MKPETVQLVPGRVAGVQIVNHVVHADGRGEFAEVRREEWGVGPTPVQWNCSRSKSNALRGVHVHLRQSDYLMVLDGAMTLNLKDMRRQSSTYGLTEVLELRGDVSQAVGIPPGVAHGFCFSCDAMILIGVSHYWSADDELGCRWDDPELGMSWPSGSPILSKRDATAGAYGAMLAAVDRGLGNRHR